MIWVRKHWRVLVICLFVFIAYGLTLRMYFFQDDSALIFKLQHPEGAAGSFGAGLWTEGPYQYLVVPFVPFFPIFQLDPFGYFLIGLVTYLIATLTFYLFSKEIFSDARLAFFSSLIFAVGYLGSDTMFRVINSWQTNIGLTLALLCLYFYILYLKKRNIKNYFLGLLFYFLSVKLIFIRSHSLVFPVIFIDFLYSLMPFKLKKLPSFVLRQIPFILIFRANYLAGGDFGGSGLTTFFKQTFLLGKIENLSSFFANVGNIFVPDIIQNKFYSVINNQFLIGESANLQVQFVNLILLVAACILVYLISRKLKIKRKFIIVYLLLVGGFFLNLLFYQKYPYWYRSVPSVIAGAIGIYSTIIIFTISIFVWKRNKSFSVILIFGFALALSQIFGYYTQYPDAIFGTTHRYFTYSLLGYSLVGAVIAGSLSSRKKYCLVGFIVILNLFFLIKYENSIVLARSIPTRNFYQDLKRYVPNIGKGEAFYFDVDSDEFYQRQFNDFFSVGSMPDSTAIAIYYGVDRNDVVFINNNPDELFFKIADGQVNIDHLHTFYYGRNGLVDTSANFIANLKGRVKSIEVQPQIDNQSNTLVFKPENVDSITPLNLTFNLAIDMPINLPGGENGEKVAINYLLSRRDYYASVKAKALSEWKYQEVNYLVDNDLTTSWMAHRIIWHDKKSDQVTLDLGRVKNIDRVEWVNTDHLLTPINYSYEVSNNGKDWIKVLEVKGEEKQNNYRVSDRFSSQDARFVRMNIYRTVSGDSPAISEMEVIETKYSGIDSNEAQRILDNPPRELYRLIVPLVKFDAYVSSDKWTMYKFGSYQAYVDGRYHQYSITIPAGGVKLSEVRVQIKNLPVGFRIGKSKLGPLPLSDLKIKFFSEN